MLMPASLPTADFAPCGIDCAACYARLRRKDPCPGCLSRGAGKPAHCEDCGIKGCAASRGTKRCFSCAEFPCSLVKRIDKRYRTGYGIDLVGNGVAAREAGLGAFMETERKRWLCPSCGGIVDMHRRTCSECGKEYPLGGTCKRPAKKPAARSAGAAKRKTTASHATAMPPPLSDPAVFPSEEVLADLLGDRCKGALDAFLEENRAAHPTFTSEWRYYNDGKRWLMKGQVKKNTVFWLSAGEKEFRATFYLNASADRDVMEGDFPEESKAGWKEATGKKGRGLTISVKSKKDLPACRAAAALKLQ